MMLFQKKRLLGQGKLDAFLQELRLLERSELTLRKYRHDLECFFAFLGRKRRVTKTDVIQYKEHLSEQYAVSSANSMLTALNGFFKFCGWSELQVKLLKVQRKSFSDRNREIQREDYARLLEAAAEKGDQRLCLLLQTLCATGIRVSEVEAVTVETAAAGRALIRNKGKHRTILLPRALCVKLLAYADARGIRSGCIFVTRTGKPMDRSNIWRAMKGLCQDAGVTACKVYPHNLRHLFAKSFYEAEKDIVHLADILGHSSVDTTRLYVLTSGEEHERQLEGLGLVREVPEEGSHNIDYVVEAAAIWPVFLQMYPDLCSLAEI